MTRTVFWVSAGFVVYTYVGYPVLLWILQKLMPRRGGRAASEPSVSLLIAAYNEADVIADKIRNSLELDYPADRLEIVVASDGSTDRTAEIVRKIADREGRGRVRLLKYPRNRGKIQVLNDAISELGGDIVAFSDASSMLAPEALRKLVANFADARVGAASGVYQVRNKDAAALGRQEDLYWKYETFLKLQEARLGAVTGAHGSLYAIRRALYPFPPPGTINDDFVIPTSVLRHGYRIAYEPKAVAFEEAHEMEGFGRRVRITAGNVAQLHLVRDLLWPPRPIVLLCFLSHKAARLVVPVALGAMLITSGMLVADGLYAALLALQLAFYALAAWGVQRRLPKILRLPYYFCMINSALFVWLYYRFARPRGQSLAWGGRT